MPAQLQKDLDDANAELATDPTNQDFIDGQAYAQTQKDSYVSEPEKTPIGTLLNIEKGIDDQPSVLTGPAAMKAAGNFIKSRIPQLSRFNVANTQITQDVRLMMHTEEKQINSVDATDKFSGFATVQLLAYIFDNKDTLAFTADYKDHLNGMVLVDIPEASDREAVL